MSHSFHKLHETKETAEKGETLITVNQVVNSRHETDWDKWNNISVKLLKKCITTGGKKVVIAKRNRKSREAFALLPTRHSRGRGGLLIY